MTSQSDADTIQRLIEMTGAIVTLLVLLDRPASRVTKEHHYSVKGDATPEEILERCLQVMSDVILDEVVDSKYFQLIINRLFSAATIVTRCDSIASMSNSADLDFSVDVFEQTALSSTSLDHYDADDSASTSSDEDDRERHSNVTSSTTVVSEKIVAAIVEIIIGLGKKDSDKNYDRIIEYGLAKLATLGTNVDNLKLFADIKLCSRLLDGLGHILKQPMNGGTLSVTLLELVTVLSSHKMSRNDFRQIVAFFKTCPALPDSNLGLILDHLHRVVGAASCPATDQPSVFLKFSTGAS